MVDHLFAFEGDGIIRDYPGNYTQYREAMSKGLLEKNPQQIMKNNEDIIEPISVKNTPVNVNTTAPKKLSFKEKFELETIEKEMPELNKEKQLLEEKMSGNLSYEELQQAAARISTIIQLLDDKELRWLELSEKTT
jgi:ATP-binding cassette subfamily F protein uup